MSIVSDCIAKNPLAEYHKFLDEEVLPKLRSVRDGANVLRKLETNPDRQRILDNIIATATDGITALRGYEP